MTHQQEQLELFKDFKIEKLNFTKIAVFLRCPKEYFHRFLLKDQTWDPQGEEILEGRVLHKTVREYLKLPLSERKSEEVLRNLYSSDIFNKLNYKDILINAIRLFDQSILATLKNPQLEVSFKTSIDKFIFTGRIDCLVTGKNRWMLLDFKRSKLDLQPYETNIDKYLQLVFYCYGMKLDKSLKNNMKLGYYYFLDGETDVIDASSSFLKSGFGL